MELTETAGLGQEAPDESLAKGWQGECPSGREDIPVEGSTGLGKWLVPGDE